MRLRKNAVFLLVFAVLILLSGCAQQGGEGVEVLGMRKTESCTPEVRFSDKIRCYHEAAITYAHLATANLEGAPKKAEDACDSIMAVNTQMNIQNDNDLTARAENERNACYFDIARIIARVDSGAADYCGRIDQTDNLQTNLQGARVTREICIDTVERQIQKRQEDYVGNPSNLCSIFFVLPLLVLAAFMKK